LNGSNELRITPVENKSDLKTFIQIPKTIFKDDPNWVPPLDIERRLHLSKKTNPYFEHARWNAWIAWRGNTPVGRITAQVDPLSLEKHQDNTGFFGMIDAEDNPDTFKALFSAAEAWLKAEGVTRARGPFNLSINDEVGLLIDGFDTDPMFMMGHAKAYFGQRVEECGYAKSKDLLAYIVKTDEFEKPRVMQWLLDKAPETITVRPMDKSKFDQELITLRELFNDAWSDNWGFVPFTEEEFKDLGQTLKLLIASDLIQIAEVNGEPAAFIVALPNLNEVIKNFNGSLLPLGWAKLLWNLKVKFPKSARVPLMGVKKKFHNTLGPALSFLIISKLLDNLAARGVQEIEMSWILEDNAGMNGIIKAIGGKVYKTYRVYDKDL